MKLLSKYIFVDADIRIDENEYNTPYFYEGITGYWLVIYYPNNRNIRLWSNIVAMRDNLANIFR